MKYVLDGECMTSREEVHAYIKEEIEIPYGDNLDALYDILSSMSDLEIELINADTMLTNLGHYGSILLRVLNDAATNNEGFTLTIV